MKTEEAEAKANQRDALADLRSLPVRVIYNLWQHARAGLSPAPGGFARGVFRHRADQ